MRTNLLTLVFTLFSILIFAQNQASQNSTAQLKTTENLTYQLFPTENFWTFIKLDTRNGKMWQVQFDVEGDNRGESQLNIIPLVKFEKEVKGRFTLYPTKNMYNFLLLDQIDGFVYQVQWSIEKEKRGVIPIF